MKQQGEPGGLSRRIADGSSLTWTFHTARGTPTDRSRRREEADPLQRPLHPPPHLGGYDVCEQSGLTIQHLGEVRREKARLQEK